MLRNLGLAAALLCGSLLLAEPPILGVWLTATLFAAVAVVYREQWPITMLALCTFAAATHLMMPVPMAVIDLAPPILLYTVASRYRRAISLLPLAALVSFAAWWTLSQAMDKEPKAGVPQALREVMAMPKPPGVSVVVVEKISVLNTGSLALLSSILIASWALGSSARSRRAHAEDLERQRDQQAAFAVAAERSRISRELHDVVAHGLSVMVVQAQGAQAALDNRPSDTRAALTAIVAVGRDSLAEMRRVLNAVAWRPQPGMAQLPELIDQVRHTGTQIQLRIEGEPVPLASTVDLSAYRIVQEALTNTMKHAGEGATAEVMVSYQDKDLVIEVSDTGRGPRRSDSKGTGIRGMQERAQLLGGQLTAGPGSHGGFVVRAKLPRS